MNYRTKLGEQRGQAPLLIAEALRREAQERLADEHCHGKLKLTVRRSGEQRGQAPLLIAKALRREAQE